MKKAILLILLTMFYGCGSAIHTTDTNIKKLKYVHSSSAETITTVIPKIESTYTVIDSCTTDNAEIFNARVGSSTVSISRKDKKIKIRTVIDSSSTTQSVYIDTLYIDRYVEKRSTKEEVIYKVSMWSWYSLAFNLLFIILIFKIKF